MNRRVAILLSSAATLATGVAHAERPKAGAVRPGKDDDKRVALKVMVATVSAIADLGLSMTQMSLCLGSADPASDEPKPDATTLPGFIADDVAAFIRADDSLLGRIVYAREHGQPEGSVLDEAALDKVKLDGWPVSLSCTDRAATSAREYLGLRASGLIYRLVDLKRAVACGSSRQTQDSARRLAEKERQRAIDCAAEVVRTGQPSPEPPAEAKARQEALERRELAERREEEKTVQRARREAERVVDEIPSCDDNEPGGEVADIIIPGPVGDGCTRGPNDILVMALAAKAQVPREYISEPQPGNAAQPKFAATLKRRLGFTRYQWAKCIGDPIWSMPGWSPGGRFYTAIMNLQHVRACYDPSSPRQGEAERRLRYEESKVCECAELHLDRLIEPGAQPTPGLLR